MTASPSAASSTTAATRADTVATTSRWTRRSRCLSVARPGLGLLVCASLMATASARIQSTSVVLEADGSTISLFDSFGFRPGGSASFDVNFRRQSTRDSQRVFAYVLGCEEKDMLNFEAKLEQKCNQQVVFWNSTLNTDECHYKFRIDETNKTMETLTITKKEIVTWAVVMCGGGKAQVDMDYTFMNPGGEHLDTGHDPLPRLFTALLVIWILLTSGQGVHALAWHATKITNLHRIILGVPLVKAMYCGVCLYKWTFMSTRGFFPEWVLIMHVTAITVNQAVTFGTLLLVARGWLITRRHLPNTEKQTTATSIALLVVLNFAYRYYSLSNFSFFALAILYMTILALILSSVARNIRELKMQIMILRQADIDPTSTPAHMKAVMYRRYQLVMFSFVCTKIFLEMVLLFLRQFPWVTELFSEVVDLSLCVAVGYIFRLRANNPFNTEQGDFSWLPFNTAELGARDGNTQTLIARMAELGVQIALPPPNIYETEIYGAALPGSINGLLRYDNEGCVEIPSGGQTLVVVENPPNLGKEGELTENVSMAACDRLVQPLDPGTSESVSESVEVVADGAASTAVSHGDEAETEMDLMMWIHPHSNTGAGSVRGVGSVPHLSDLPGTNGLEFAEGRVLGESRRADQNV
mmetsp:Transcript_36939/g.91912  ORF Transcript_36939/g.91912 Transcript_36939/m.91912 type:complete len:640 (-) Transcript_36939:183-2102(-)|eukprot:CAMPEP_0181362264 /NCGR_PEP_ID=MMETSP1106-20121128/7884_1 /TAXON_ID=81844 /ORGANISM="Mantoniella antarctica, Strain SL-175" /LENGTH=639 /DNA_ID=CAMNT_0023476147 /DNA_START=155 /DNA_END=2074 /DNA_ORIENTATION=+